MIAVKTPIDLRAERERRGRVRCGQLTIAPLWAQKGENLGTLIRTCDAVGACLAVCQRPWTRSAVERGDTIKRGFGHVHIFADPIEFLEEAKRVKVAVVGVELAHGAVPLRDVAPVCQPTVVLLGAENGGLPPEALPYIDWAIEIPMKGVGSSLNVAVAGSLALYRLAGMS